MYLSLCDVCFGVHIGFTGCVGSKQRIPNQKMTLLKNDLSCATQFLVHVDIFSKTPADEVVLGVKKSDLAVRSYLYCWYVPIQTSIRHIALVCPCRHFMHSDSWLLFPLMHVWLSPIYLFPSFSRPLFTKPFSKNVVSNAI